MRPSDLDERRFGEFLYTAGQPDPDLLIRTSGEMRVSNFLLWQIAYAEIWVTETLWPDFRRRHLLEAVLAYQKRDRRYGGIKPSPVARSAPSDARPERRRARSSSPSRVVWFAPPLVFLRRRRRAARRSRSYEFVGARRARAASAACPRSPAALAAVLTSRASCALALGAPCRLPLDVVLMSALVALGALALRAWRGGADALATVAAALFPSLYLGLPIGALVAIRETRRPRARCSC